MTHSDGSISIGNIFLVDTRTYYRPIGIHDHLLLVSWAASYPLCIYHHSNSYHIRYEHCNRMWFVYFEWNCSVKWKMTYDDSFHVHWILLFPYRLSVFNCVPFGWYGHCVSCTIRCFADDYIGRLYSFKVFIITFIAMWSFQTDFFSNISFSALFRIIFLGWSIYLGWNMQTRPWP